MRKLNFVVVFFVYIFVSFSFFSSKYIVFIYYYLLLLLLVVVIVVVVVVVFFSLIIYLSAKQKYKNTHHEKSIKLVLYKFTINCQDEPY